jgi:WD40 repeat protein
VSLTRFALAVSLVLSLGRAALADPNLKGPAPTDRFGDPLPDGAIARIGTVRFRHGRPVNAIAYSPDGRTLISGCDDHLVRLWDAASGKELRRFRGHSYRVVAVAFSPDGKAVASAAPGGDQTIRLWETATGKELWQTKGHALSLAFSPDGKVLASGGLDKRIHLLDAATGKVQGQLRGHKQPITSVAFSPKADVLASASGDKMVRLWEVATGKELRQLSGHEDEVKAIAFSPDGKTLVSAGDDQVIVLWDVDSGKEHQRLRGHHWSVSSVAFSPDGKTLASGEYSSTTILWEAATGKILHRLEAPRPTYSLAFSPDSKTLASGHADGAVRTWEMSTGKRLHPDFDQPGFDSEVTFLYGDKTLFTQGDSGAFRWEAATGKKLGSLVYGGTLSPDHRFLAWTDKDEAIHLTEAATGKDVRRFQGNGGDVFSIVITPNGKVLASQDIDNRTIRTWEMETGKELRRFTEGLDDLALWSFGSGGKTFLLGGGDGRFHVRDADTGKELSRIQFADSYSFNLSPNGRLTLAPNGRLLAQIGQSPGKNCPDTIILWDLPTGKQVRQLPWQEDEDTSKGDGGPLAFTPDGKALTSLAGPKGNAVSLLELATGKERCRFEGHGDWVSGAIFSSDGRLLATRSYDLTLRVWEAATGKELRRLKGHQGLIRSISFSSDGRALASASEDGTVLVWDVSAALPEEPQSAKLSPKELDGLWEDLARADAAKAFRAIGLLSSVPAQSVPLLHERLRPAAPPDAEKVAKLVADLDSAQFTVREKATKELEALDELAGPFLRKALEGEPPPELRKRARELLDCIEAGGFSAEGLRARRALEVLERLGTPEARQVLQTLTKGVAEARLTQGAKESLERLTKRAAKP